MMVPIGLNTASLQKRRDIGIDEIVDFVLDNNFSAVEFRDEYPFSENVSKEEAELIKEKLAGNNIRCSVHLPFYDINLSAFRPDVRIAGLNILKKSLNKAWRLGAVTVTVHGGSMRRNYYSESWEEYAYKLSIESLKELADEAEKYNIRILVENLNLFKKNELVVHYLPDIMLKTKKELNDRIGFTFDVGHAVSTPLNPVDFVEHLGSGNIVLAHLNDNHLNSDEHLAVGDGAIDYDSFVEAYINRGWGFTLLFETATVESALRSKAYLNRLVAKYSL
ncbi:MAG: sugar phosphate isomerase/epimerase [Spirochaetes bacterium]|nr:sugar phosphate isomerase/epimerase [Spirochaetota bacterium]